MMEDLDDQQRKLHSEALAFAAALQSPLKKSSTPHESAPYYADSTAEALAFAASLQSPSKRGNAGSSNNSDNNSINSASNSVNSGVRNVSAARGTPKLVDFKVPDVEPLKLGGTYIAPLDSDVADILGSFDANMTRESSIVKDAEGVSSIDYFYGRGAQTDRSGGPGAREALNSANPDQVQYLLTPTHNKRNRNDNEKKNKSVTSLEYFYGKREDVENELADISRGRVPSSANHRNIRYLILPVNYKRPVSRGDVASMRIPQLRSSLSHSTGQENGGTSPMRGSDKQDGDDLKYLATRVPSPSGRVRPVSREDVQRMEIPSFGSRSRPQSRELSRQSDRSMGGGASPTGLQYSRVDEEPLNASGDLDNSGDLAEYTNMNAELSMHVESTGVGDSPPRDRGAGKLSAPLGGDLSEFAFGQALKSKGLPNPERKRAKMRSSAVDEAMRFKPQPLSPENRPNSTQMKYQQLYQGASSRGGEGAGSRIQSPEDRLGSPIVPVTPGAGPGSVDGSVSMLSMPTKDDSYVDDVSSVAGESNFGPFPFPAKPALPHVDEYIGSHKLTYKEINKPFLTHEDKEREKIKAKSLQKMMKKKRHYQKLLAMQRRREHERKILEAEYSVDQINAAMLYFRTMCNGLLKNAKKIDDEYSVSNEESGVGPQGPEQEDGMGVNDEIRLDELEAVLRKYRRAKVTRDEENHGRELLLSLEWLLHSLKLSPMEWFTMVDTQNHHKAGNQKLSYQELVIGIDMLCDKLSHKLSEQQRKAAVRNGASPFEAGEENYQVPYWRRSDIHALLKYLDPNGDGDISPCEIRLAFKQLHNSLKTQEIIDQGGPIIEKLFDYIHHRQIKISDLFFMIDTDKSGTISTDELFDGMNNLFRSPGEGEADGDNSVGVSTLGLSSIVESASDDMEADLGSLGEYSLGSMSLLSLDTSINTKQSSRFGNANVQDMSSSWQPRGNLNSRGKHTYLKRKSRSVRIKKLAKLESDPAQSLKDAVKDGDSVAGSVLSNSTALGTAASRASRRSQGSRVTANSRQMESSGAARNPSRQGSSGSALGIVRQGSVSSNSISSGSRMNSGAVAAKEMLKGTRRGGTFMAGAQGGLPGLPGGLPAGLPGGMVIGKGGSSRAAKLAHVKLQKSHQLLIRNYDDLFQRQNGFLGQNKPDLTSDEHMI